MSEPIDLKIIEAWLSARSIARGLPQPVHDHGGLRVDTDLPDEACRWVFARPVDGLRELARTVREPRMFLKLCGSPELLAALAPAPWQLQHSASVMSIRDAKGARPSIPDGYRSELERTEIVTAARIVARDGTVAASGYAAEHAGVFAYDRIATHPTHRRRGLGRAIMSMLASERRSVVSRPVLVATESGRLLYQSMGWIVLSPYSTVTILDGL